MSFRKHHDAVARDKFLESEEGRKLREGTPSGVYLENRLVVAFMRGIDHGRAVLDPDFPATFKDRASAKDGQWYYTVKDEGYVVMQRRNDPACGGIDDRICWVGLLESDAASIARDHNILRAAASIAATPAAKRKETNDE
jgi:hypothetical protein